MTTRAASTRNGVAFGLSVLLHVGMIVILLFKESGPYELPVPPSPPVEMEIEPAPEPLEIPPPPKIPTPPAPTTPTIVPPKISQPKVTPTPTTPPVPQPTPTPQTQVVRPITQVQASRPAPVTARPIAPQPFSPLAEPQFAPTPAPAPATTQAPAAAPAAPTLSHLNVHKSEKNAPAGTPTLPIAPSPAPASAGGGGGAPAVGGSRLGGLTPYGPGGMPTGGLGLRGSLVGCANADRVGLSSVERARCDQRFGVNAEHAPHLDDISPERRGAFDKRTADDNAWKAYRDSPHFDSTPQGDVEQFSHPH